MPAIRIQNDGTVQFIYSDKLHQLFEGQGDVSIRRASHVEPTDEGKWSADLAPVGGPILGPFTTRQEALDQEVKWLEHNIIRSLQNQA